jgi:hypothetical protein
MMSNHQRHPDGMWPPISVEIPAFYRPEADEAEPGA